VAGIASVIITNGSQLRMKHGLKGERSSTLGGDQGLIREIPPPRPPLAILTFAVDKRNKTL
jgi:hypothetical protein